MGATVGSVIPTADAIIPAAVGVDIGCGMMAVRTTLRRRDLPDNLRGPSLRHRGRGAARPHRQRRARRSRRLGATSPRRTRAAWAGLDAGFDAIVAQASQVAAATTSKHLGTLGTGNHFIEVCLDEADRVWFMLHSGSRGVGNRIGSYFIELAKDEMRRLFINLPDQDLAYLPEGTEHFADYVEAVQWAQGFARDEPRADDGSGASQAAATG